MRFGIVFSILLFLSGLLSANPKQEIRAVWLTTNYGLDWPSNPLKANSDVLIQKKELDQALVRLKEANINVVFLQVRLRGDVIYPSQIEPYNNYIKTNSYRNPDYDLLAYAIDACHEKGMECHAWFVTYPLGTKSKNTIPPGLKNKPYLIKIFRNELYLDPGNPETNTYLLSLIAELVNKYDIDGVHFDYVRYPDKSAQFPDESTYKQYGKNQTKDDWRRQNVNRFIYAAYDTIKALKPWALVSSSVIGMYKKIGNTPAHWTAYHDVYQDPIDWLEKGKHDLITPMMYYSDDLFFPFVSDWVSRNNERMIVPGLGLYQMDEKEKNWSRETILNQVRYSREQQTHGNAFYRMKYLTDNKKGILDELKKIYSTPALLPPLTWLSDTIPAIPQSFEIISKDNRIYFQWETPENSRGMIFYNLYRSSKFPVDMEDSENLIANRLPEARFELPLDNSIESGYYYAITAYDRFHNESEASFPVYFVTGDFEK
jgi:Uncharacterized protein conserved in bacteria